MLQVVQLIVASSRRELGCFPRIGAPDGNLQRKAYLLRFKQEREGKDFRQGTALFFKKRIQQLRQLSFCSPGRGRLLTAVGERCESVGHYALGAALR